MEYLFYILIGVLGGLLGGMGMGGGTVLIPLLNIIFGISQHTAQAINLISFIPMSIISLIFHIKNKLVKFKGVLWIILPGIISCIIGTFIAKQITGELLKRMFGGFLICLSVFQLVVALKNKAK